MKTWTRLSLAIALWLVMTPTVGDAAIRRVPSEFEAIQFGLNNAGPGDTVLVAAGTYTGPANQDLSFGGFDICLMSEDGPEATIIHAGGAGRAIAFFNGETEAAIMEGFTLTMGNVNVAGGAILCDNASPTIRNCLIVDNLGPSGGGIALFESHPVFEDCVIRQNIAFAGAGGGICCVDSSPTFSNCSIIQNISTGPGGGVDIQGESFPSFVNCVIAGNDATTGGGLCASSAPRLTIETTTIASNRGSQQGGGLFLADVPVSLESSIVWGNCSPDGADAYLDSDADVTPSCSDFDPANFTGPGTLQTGVLNVVLDPMFCDPAACDDVAIPAGSYGVSSASPLVPIQNCGTIGGQGVACKDTPIEATTWGRIKALGR